MSKNDIIEQIKSFLDAHDIENCLYCDEYNNLQLPMVDFADDWVDDCCLYWGNYTIKTGASKICFTNIHPTKVYKIAYTHTFDSYETSIDNLDEAYVREVSDNFCYLEHSNYSLAKGILKDIFTKTSYFATINGLEVYEQDKVVAVLSDIEEKNGNIFCDTASLLRRTRLSKMSDKYLDLQKSQYYNDFVPIGKTVFACLVNQYGWEAVLNLYDFCKKQGINDITIYNVGYDKFNKLKIFDYSGFNEDYY